jgi:hypothetical protein
VNTAQDEIGQCYHCVKAIYFSAAECPHCGSREPGGPLLFSTNEERPHWIEARNDRTMITITVVCGIAGAAYGLLSSHTFADVIAASLLGFLLGGSIGFTVIVTTWVIGK